jgi:hypothetical protein
MAIRSGMTNLVDRLRALSNAGTAQYTAGTITYWTDDHLQDTLGRHETWVVEDQLTWIPQNIGGTAQFLTAQGRYKDLEEAESGTTRWQVRQTEGTAEGTANYTADYVQGRITWSTDQGGTAYMLATAYSYDLYGAAVDVLEHQLAYVEFWYDFEADNQEFSRSQIKDNINGLIATYRRRIGDNLPGKSGDVFISQLVRTDINTSW